MAARNTSPLKKPLVAINELGKKLTKSSIYLIEYDECKLISSSIKDNGETFNVTVCDLNKEYQEYLPYLGYAVNGKELGRVLKGTGVEIENDGYKLTVSSKIKVKDEKVDAQWNTNESFNDNDKRFEILKNYNKLERVMRPIRRESYYSSFEYNLNEILENNQFIKDISDELNVSILKITNRMIKFVDKSTESLTSYVTAPIINTNDQIKRMHIIESKSSVGIVRSYYPFIDK